MRLISSGTGDKGTQYVSALQQNAAAHPIVRLEP